MPAVFVHGVPDTARVWRPLLDALGRADVVTLSLPGFGCATPGGFDATKEAYVDWLLRELHAIEGPIDLVAHDWGCLLIMRAVSLEPGIARSWAAGSAPLSADYEWHPVAQMWQTPGVGEQLMETMTPAAMVDGLVAAGVPRDAAQEAADRVDAEMKRCILALYRSGVRAGAEWQSDLGRVTAPGLVLWGAEDPYASDRFGAQLAKDTGARLVSLPGCSHWWPLERPVEVAKELRVLWSEAS